MPDIYEIPLLLDDSSFKIRTILEDVQVVFKFDWNTRTELWSISIYDPIGTPLLMGLPLVVDTELLERFQIDGLPPGLMMLYDTSGLSVECDRDGLGDRCRLLYQTIA